MFAGAVSVSDLVIRQVENGNGSGNATWELLQWKANAQLNLTTESFRANAQTTVHYQRRDARFGDAETYTLSTASLGAVAGVFAGAVSVSDLVVSRVSGDTGTDGWQVLGWDAQAELTITAEAFTVAAQARLRYRLRDDAQGQAETYTLASAQLKAVNDGIFTGEARATDLVLRRSNNAEATNDWEILSWNAFGRLDLVAGDFQLNVEGEVRYRLHDERFGGGPTYTLAAATLSGGSGIFSGSVDVRDLVLEQQIAQNGDINWVPQSWNSEGVVRLGAERISIEGYGRVFYQEADASLRLEMRELQIGDQLRAAQASGRYGLNDGQVSLEVTGLDLQTALLRIQGAARLQIGSSTDPDRWLEIAAAGRVALVPVSASLQADLQFGFDRDLELATIDGRIAFPAGERFLGDLELSGDLEVSYQRNTQQLALTGSVNLAGIEAQTTIQLTSQQEGFSADLELSNETPIQLGEGLILSPKLMRATYTYDPNGIHQLALEGSGSISILGRELDVTGNIRLDLDPTSRTFRLNRGSLQLQQALLDLQVAGFAVDLIADSKGELPGLILAPKDNLPSISISGALRLPQLGGLTLQLDPTEPLRFSPEAGWQFPGEMLDLTPHGPLQFGLLEIGDGAFLTADSEGLLLYPDLAIDTDILGRVLAPTALSITNTLNPILTPVVSLLKFEINLDVLTRLEEYKPLVDFDLWKTVDEAGDQMHRKLLDTFEATPGNPYIDGRLQVVEIIDSLNYFFYRLIKTDPASAKLLANQFGLSESFVYSVIEGAPYVSVAQIVAVLDAVQAFGQKMRAVLAQLPAEPSGTMTRLQDLRFRFASPAQRQLLGSVLQSDEQPSAVLSALQDLQQTMRRLSSPAPPSGQLSSRALIELNADLSIPVLDDPLQSVLNLLTGQPIDLLDLALSLQANLSLRWDQKIPLSVYGFPVPLVLGIEGGLAGELNASLGLTSDGPSLLSFAQTLQQGDVAPAIRDLLMPSAADDLGLYLAGVPGRPLLQLSPRLRLDAGIDYGLVGLRGFVGVGGSAAIHLAEDRLYLGDLVDKLTSPTPPAPADLARLFGIDANVYSQLGLDARVLGWFNLATLTLPIMQVSLPRLSLGPVINGEVRLVSRTYGIGGVNPEEITPYSSHDVVVRTDERGRYSFVPPADPTKVGNGDSVFDFRDALQVAGHPHEDGSISLVDSLSGLDLGIPLVGLPNGNINLLTTLKYTTLLRWNPSKTLAGQPLTPERISEVFATLFEAVPAAFTDDSYDLYSGLVSPDSETRAEALDTLVFSYQQLAVVLTVLELLRRDQLDYSRTAAWGFEPQPQTLDRPELVSFSAYGQAIVSLFGIPGADGLNPNDKLHRPPIAPRFDVQNPEHLRAVLAEILTRFPTRRFFKLADAALPAQRLADDFVVADVRSPAQQQSLQLAVEQGMGSRLDHLASGLSQLTRAIRGRLDQSDRLDSLIPVAGSQLLPGATAGPKRKILQELIPALVASSDASSDAAFAQAFEPLLNKPSTIDAADRQGNDLVEATLHANQLQSVLELPVPSASDGPATDQVLDLIVHLNLRNRQGDPLTAPDYGLSIRYRFGGTAIPGVDVTLPAGESVPLVYIPPGASSTVLHLQLHRSFFARPDALLQLQFLSADSGYAVGDSAAVVSFVLPGHSQVLDGTSRSFQPGILRQSRPTSPWPLVQPVGGPAAVLHALDGRPDRIVLRPGLGPLPHITGFKPQDGDRLLIDPQALQRLRQDPANRQFSAEAEAEALARLTAALGAEAIERLEPGVLQQQLTPLLEQIEPLPLPDPGQIATFAGVLFDQVSGRPLALLSDQGVDGRDLAWSSLQADSAPGLIELLPDPTPLPLRLPGDRTLQGQGVLLALDADLQALEATAAQTAALSSRALSLELQLPSDQPSQSFTAELTALSGDLPAVVPVPATGPIPYVVPMAVAATGGLEPIAYDPSRHEGVRIYDINGDNRADTVALELRDGGASDRDGRVDGWIANLLTASVVELEPILQPQGPTLLRVVDPKAPTAGAGLLLTAELTTRAASTQQLMALVLDPQELDHLDAIAADLPGLRARARPLFSSLEDHDLTLPDDRRFSSPLLLRQGQSLQVFAIQDAGLDQLASAVDPRLQWLSPEPLAPDRVRYASTSGLQFELQLERQLPGLDDLIARQQGLAPLLDCTAFSSADPLIGTLQLAREASFDAVLGFYRSLDARGSVRDAQGLLLRPGDAGYAAAALAPENVVAPLSALQLPDRQTRTMSVELRESSLLAPYAVVADPRGPQTYFAFSAANPDGLTHIRSLGRNSFGLEDQFGLGDHDLDDVIMRLQFQPGA